MIPFKEAPPSIKKDPLNREELRDVIDLALWSGQLLLHFGADTQRIEETVHRIGTGLGADWMDILISPNGVIITTTSGGEFRTKLRRVVNIAVNMAVVDEVNRLSRRVASHELDRFQVRQELERIDKLKPEYDRWMVVLMVGLACAAFSRLFGGDWAVFFVTLIASSTAMYVRQEMLKNYFHHLIVVFFTAFVAGILASAASLFNLSPNPQTAIAAAVLLLVPGVPLINATEDLINGHMVTGIVRGINGGIIVLMLALGLFMAVELMGIHL